MSATESTTSHSPLDSLSAAEIAAASEVVRREMGFDDDVIFIFVSLDEPPKEAVISAHRSQPGERRAHLVIRDRTRRKSFEAIVSISSGRIVDCKELSGIQPAITRRESLLAEAAVKGDPRWQAAMRRRGVEDFDRCIIDSWVLGYEEPRDSPEQGRFVRPLTWVRPEDGSNAYTWPVEGLSLRLDLDTMRLVSVDDYRLVPLGEGRAEYTVEGMTRPDNMPSFPAGPRPDLRPLDIVQPHGVSFRMSGSELSWQKWRMRLGFNAREGLVLYTIGYEDQGTVRPIVYRASLAELFVPYGDPSPIHRNKNTFDMGEVGIGVNTNSLEYSCDCLGQILYLDGVVNDNAGAPVVIKNAVCIHEEDHGILWKHTDRRTGTVEVRRSRRLVVSSIATLGNYEYGMFWYFYQDGTIGFEAKLTGVISNGGVEPEASVTHGTLVAPGVYGPNHQHYFSIRLDMMVDGMENAVYECDSVASPIGPDNPMGNAWTVRETLLERESTAQRLMDLGASRFWKIVNRGRINALGQPVAYKLVPGANALPLHHPDAPAIRRAGFASRHLWVTAFDPGQRFAAGDYPNQHPGGAGLPAFVKGDRSLIDKDLVLWYTLCAHHPVRPEDWPVMPCEYVGFHLKPHGFFVGNPALDVPATHDHASQ